MTISAHERREEQNFPAFQKDLSFTCLLCQCCDGRNSIFNLVPHKHKHTMSQTLITNALCMIQRFLQKVRLLEEKYILRKKRDVLMLMHGDIFKIFIPLCLSTIGLSILERNEPTKYLEINCGGSVFSVRAILKRKKTRFARSPHGQKL